MTGPRMPIGLRKRTRQATRQQAMRNHANPWSSHERLKSLRRGQPLNTASSFLDTTKSLPSPLNSGKPEALRSDHRRKIGFVPRQSSAPAVRRTDLKGGGLRVYIWIALSSSGHERSSILLATMGAAIAVLGPGAHSIDALLFGRKRLGI
jgi:hypothetical protein